MRALTLEDVLRVMNQQGQQVIDTQDNEIINLFLPNSDKAKVSDAMSLTNVATPYPVAIINDAGPTAFWLFGDPIGTTAPFDSNPYGPKLSSTVNGTVTFGQGGVFGALKAAAFDGTSGYVSVTDNDAVLGQTNSLSVEAWVSATAWQPSGAIFNRRTAANVGGFSLETDGTNIKWYVYTTAWHSVVATAPSTGTYHHLVGTYDGANLTLYIDGVATSVALTGAVNDPASPLVQIGKNATGASFFKGSMSMVAFYPVALSAAQVTKHFQWAGNVNGAYTYNYGAPTKYGLFTYPKPPQRGSNRWGSAIWGNAAFTWG